MISWTTIRFLWRAQIDGVSWASISLLRIYFLLVRQTEWRFYVITLNKHMNDVWFCFNVIAACSEKWGNHVSRTGSDLLTNFRRKLFQHKEYIVM